MTTASVRYAPRACLGAARGCLLSAVLTLPALARADVVPFHCVDPSGTAEGLVTVWIGYENDSDTPVMISVGPNNFFSPSPNIRGQITTFLPGVHERAFPVLFGLDDPQATYHLDGAALEITLGLEDYCSSAVKALVATPSGWLFAGMAEAGVFRSIDGGVSWHPANVGLGNLHVHTLELHPASPTIVFAGTEEGVYKSLDSGDSWHAMNNGLPGIDAP